MPSPSAPTLSLPDRTRRRVALRVLPFCTLLYIIAYLDRVNVSFAALEMTRELNFNPKVYGFGAGIFFIGYTALEIPGSLLAERWSARLWISRIMISWGLVAVAMAFIQTETQFYTLRFLLGLGEAGFFPALIVHLTHWFRAEDRAKAIAGFMFGMPIASIFGAPISGLLMKIEWLGWAGWRWLFVLEGLPAILLGIVVLFVFKDRPKDAPWMPQDERDWLENELHREHELQHHERPLTPWQPLRTREVATLALAYFCALTGFYGLTLWLPTLVKKLSNLPTLAVTFLSAIPYIAALLAMLAVGWSSDRTRERRWHAAVALCAGSLGLALGASLQNSPPLAMLSFCLAGAGLSGYLPAFWSLPRTYLSGAAAAAAIGLINMLGNLGGFVGPYVVGFLNNKAGNFGGGIAYLAASALLAAFLILSLKPAPSRSVSPQP